jgi:Planctomycete cytochrome C
LAGLQKTLERDNTMKTGILSSSLLVSSALLLAACGEKEISFKTDVQPILQQYCVECHAEGGKGTEKSGLVLSSYESVMKGTRFGSIIKPGDALSSTLIMLVEGRADPSIKMPHGKESLPKEKIELLKQWVAQGAKNN